MINPIVGGLLSDVKAEGAQPGVPVINSAQGSPSAPSLLGLNNWRDAFVGPSGQPPQIPQPQMQASPYMQATPLGNDTMGYGIDPVTFQGLLESLMPPPPQPMPSFRPAFRGILNGPLPGSLAGTYGGVTQSMLNRGTTR